MALPDPIHGSILAVDVERFSDSRRDDGVQTRIRLALYELLRASFSAASVPWDACTHEDRGDGAIVVVPAGLAKVLLLDPLLDWLAAALDEHNRQADLVEHFRLRAALHSGEVLPDQHGLAGEAIILACRLLDAAPLRAALRHSTTDLALIVSDRIYRDIVRPAYRNIDPAQYHPVEVAVKKTRAQAWIHIPGSTAPPTFVDNPSDSAASSEPPSAPRASGVHVEGTATGPHSIGVKIGKLDAR